MHKNHQATLMIYAGKFFAFIRKMTEPTQSRKEIYFRQEQRRPRPEIYTMGNRNPWRLTIDSKTGWLYWGEVGPDGGRDDPKRGARAYDEFNQARKAGNFGWPYFGGDNKPYRDYDFATQQSGELFDILKPG
jgi:glucose/arabinose dehydrogenase